MAIAVENTSNATGWAYVVGENILRTLDNGQSWKCALCGEHRPVQTKLNAVHFIDMRHGFVAGDNGVVLKMDWNETGQNWTQVRTGVDSDLHGIHALSLDVVHAVGHGGLVLRTEDGGQTWKELRRVKMMATTPDSQFIPTLKGVRFYDLSNGTVIGSCMQWLITSGIH